MKKSIIIIATTAILVAAFSACQKKEEQPVNNTAAKITEAARGEEAAPASPSPSATPAVTVAPTISPNTDTAEIAAATIPYVMDTPPFEYYISGKAIQKEVKPLVLIVRSSKVNQITDTKEWFKDNQLQSNTYQVSEAEDMFESLPAGVDTSWEDLMLTSAFYDDTYLYCTYGKDFSEGYILRIYDATSLEVKYSINFSNYSYAPDYIEEDYAYIQQKIEWATIWDNVLYISHSHPTYAKSSKNQNAYITAIDLTDISMLWRSDALVSNASDFLLLNDIILCGYGFTDEDDYLYQLNRYTGATLDKTPLASMASYMIEKDNAIYVRTYNTNYVFDVAP